MTIFHSTEGAALPAGLPEPRWQQRIDRARAVKRQLERSPALAGAPPQKPTLGECLGLCLPVDFPDLPATVTRDEIDAFCNQPGYRGGGNNGSVFDYFLDNSAGRLRYRTLVAPCYTARHDRGHYLDPAVPLGQRSAELVREAVEHHRERGLDFGQLTADDARDIRATNLLYAGPVTNAFGQGLWPHASTILGGLMVGAGRSIADYQVSAMDAQPTLGVYCHENGHMLCDFPDLYQMGAVRAGVGSFCLMGFGAVADPRNPPRIGAYLRFKAGWTTAQPLGPGQTVTAPARGDLVFQHARNSLEYFLIEYRERAARDAALPAGGLAVWHVDELGSNTWPQRAEPGHRHYECALVQADGRDDLAQGSDGDAGDLFGPTDAPAVPGAPPPPFRWRDGQPSGLQLRSIRQLTDALEFTVA